MTKKMIFNKQGMALLSILFALVIIYLLYLFVLKPQAPKINPAEKKMYQDAGVDTTSYRGIIDSTKKAVQEYEKAPTRYPYNIVVDTDQ